MAESRKKKFVDRLHYKLRLVLINDETFEEKFSFKLTPLNIFVAFSSFVVVFTFLIIVGIFYTPLREYVPGYTNNETKRNVRELLYKTDSLHYALKVKEDYFKNVSNILNGGTGLQSDTSAEERNVKIDD
jgi:hypothetical protein